MKDKKSEVISKIAKPIGGLHGVSAIFPKFKDIINYEEQKIVLNRGYPRFVTHPFIKKIENFYKKKFNAIDAISCHSFESAIFLLLDYYIKNGITVSDNEGLIEVFLKYLSHKFLEIIKRTTIDNADVIFTSENGIKPDSKKINQELIAIIKKPTDHIIENHELIDILITQDRIHDMGIILFYTKKSSNLVLLRRHIGLIPSSRKIIEKKLIEKEKYVNRREQLKIKLSKLELTNSDNCFLFPSGMAAIFFAIYSLISPKKTRFIALGSLYVDTIRILEKWPKKYNLNDTLFITSDFENQLKNSIEKDTAGVILEIPSNPLLQLIDLEKIVAIAHEKDVKIIVDSTIATPFNFNPFNFDVDIIVHSTTKFLNGKNNHLGGVIMTKNNEIKIRISILKKITNITMDDSEIKTLSRNLKNFERRMEKINENTIEIARFLNNHPKVEKVYYPFLSNDPNYALSKKYLKGGSGLISFVLKNSSHETAQNFYDNLSPPILKGPSLGSEKTLLSPYVIMAHYNDSKEYLDILGLNFYLMRISVGIEPVEKIKESLDNALNYIY